MKNQEAATGPRWVCLEGMNADELAAYDYGCAGMIDALTRILDGKDTGQGVANPPWEPLRRRVIALASKQEAAPSVRDALPWRNVAVDGMPPCDKMRVFVGINTAGFATCFNWINEHGQCEMGGPELWTVQMSCLKWWCELEYPADTSKPPHWRLSKQEAAPSVRDAQIWRAINDLKLACFAFDSPALLKAEAAIEAALGKQEAAQPVPLEPVCSVCGNPRCEGTHAIPTPPEDPLPVYYAPAATPSPAPQEPAEPVAEIGVDRFGQTRADLLDHSLAQGTKLYTQSVADAQDARRYRWLRDNGQPFIELGGVKHEAGEYGTRLAQVPWALDAAIDAAMALDVTKRDPKG
jgi:hypothetical protein